MDNKYNINCPKDVFDKNAKRLVNQLWKLIPMRENNEDWNKQLETVIIEMVGLNEIFSPRFLQLISKLEGLRVTDIDFNGYRKTVFEAITLIQEIKNEG